MTPRLLPRAAGWMHAGWAGGLVSGVQEASRLGQKGSDEPTWDLDLRCLWDPQVETIQGAGIHKSLEFKSPPGEGA